MLTVGVLLSVRWGASTLGASGDTAVGVVGLAITGARNLVALGDAAQILGSAWIRAGHVLDRSCT